jgi:elongation factor P
MALLTYSEIRERSIIIYENEPCEVVESHVARTQQRKPQNQVKLKSLLSGRTFTATFHTSDMAEEAEISKKNIKFLYQNRGEFWFCDPEDPKNRFQLSEDLISNGAQFLKDNMMVTGLVYENSNGDEQIIQIKLPIKVDLKVKDAPPTMKGNTASGGGKPITLETGAVVNAPFFVEAGDMVVVNTETGEYVERSRETK